MNAAQGASLESQVREEALRGQRERDEPAVGRQLERVEKCEPQQRRRMPGQCGPPRSLPVREPRILREPRRAREP